MKIGATILAFLFMGALSGCADARDLRTIRQTALRLEFERGVCSGTAVGVNVIATAQHCFDGGGRLIKINGKDAYALETVRDGKDHVLVRVSARFKHWAQMGSQPEQGDRIRWVGQPSGEPDVYRQGYVSRVRDGELWIDALAFHGDSGAGLMNDAGQLVGILYGGRLFASSAGMRMQLTVANELAFTAADWLEIAR
ncbi:trypsin-like serine peptidase [Lysobacter koreensis]|uniref:Serine protease n=1 Tax=Lysobacter koreensis TaxID=266122 RepID=A0ABW2YM89_9GAMM